jgi:hypothetical protein
MMARANPGELFPQCASYIRLQGGSAVGFPFVGLEVDLVTVR